MKKEVRPVDANYILEKLYKNGWLPLPPALPSTEMIAVEAIIHDAPTLKPKPQPGCDKCRAVYGRGDWNEGGCHDFRVSGNGLYFYDDAFGWEGTTIKFCPWCGRQLTQMSSEERIGTRKSEKPLICGTTGKECCECTPGPCEHRRIPE